MYDPRNSSRYGSIRGVSNGENPTNHERTRVRHIANPSPSMRVLFVLLHSVASLVRAGIFDNVGWCCLGRRVRPASRRWSSTISAVVSPFTSTHSAT